MVKQACDLGCDQPPVLMDDFTTNTVSPNGTGVYNWYHADGFTAYSITSSGLVTSSDNGGYGAD
jgi:hypothetical protein